jgi:hypothetical protein
VRGRAFLLLAEPPPRRDGVLQVQHAGAVDEVLVLREGHLRVLGRGVARNLGERVAHRPLGEALEGGGEQLPPGGLRRRDLARIGAIEKPRVGRVLQHDHDIAGGVAVDLVRADVADLLLAAVPQDQLAERVAPRVEAGVAAGLERGLENRINRGHADRVGEDDDQVAAPDFRRVADEHVGELVEARVAHRSDSHREHERWRRRAGPKTATQ